MVSKLAYLISWWYLFQHHYGANGRNYKDVVKLELCQGHVNAAVQVNSRDRWHIPVMLVYSTASYQEFDFISVIKTM